MGGTSRASAAALSVGAATLVLAALVALLRRTRGAPPAQRLRLMVRLTWSAVRSVLPPRWAVVSIAVGLVASAVSLLVGLGVTLLVIWLIPPIVPNPTEAYEGFGDAVLTFFYFGVGAVVSLCVAMCVGLLAGGHVASRYGTGAKPSDAAGQPHPGPGGGL